LNLKNQFQKSRMAYTFDILGVTPVLTFFNYQQQVEQDSQRSMAYVGSYHCTLDALIRATQEIPHKPEWDWDRVVNLMVQFWLENEARVQHWKHELQHIGRGSLLVARVANVDVLRGELEQLFER
jgi:hypothetical protein